LASKGELLNYQILLGKPLVKVGHLALLAAEGPIGVSLPRDSFSAVWTLNLLLQNPLLKGFSLKIGKGGGLDTL